MRPAFEIPCPLQKTQTPPAGAAAELASDSDAEEAAPAAEPGAGSFFPGAAAPVASLAAQAPCGNEEEEEDEDEVDYEEGEEGGELAGTAGEHGAAAANGAPGNPGQGAAEPAGGLAAGPAAMERVTLAA